MKDDPDRTEQFKRENRMAQMAKLRTPRIPWEAMSEMANIERALAAGTIQDLMDEVEAWRQAMQKADRDIAELRAERDEARRSVCEMSIQLGGVFRRVGGKIVEVTTAEGCAEIMRWDCFKEKP